MYKLSRMIVAATIGVAALFTAHAENDSPSTAGSSGAEMQDCNCWDDLLEQLQEEQQNEPPPQSNDAATS